MGSVALLAGCSGSNDYTPVAGVPGGKIYFDACAGCHKSIKEFELAAENANATFIANKVKEGSMMMSSFPNIQGEGLDSLIKYVIENSARK